MSRLDELRHVAELAGIQTRHVDALGIAHEPDEETLSHLITAFGLPPEPMQAAEALAEEARSAPLGLPPVLIVAAGAPELSLSLRAVGGAVEWDCQFEDGGGCAGRGEAAAGRPHETVLSPPGRLPLGVHRLHIAIGGATATTELIVAPQACHLPPQLQQGARSWGFTAQLYGVRGARDWGIGDFTDLAALCRGAASFGAAVVGVNPLHALFAAEPRHVSPYSPSSRSFLDYLYIDAAAVPGFNEDREAQGQATESAIAAVRGAALVDYAAVAALKRPVLEALFRRFRQDDLANGGAARTSRGAAFRDFQRSGGAALAAFAAFEALHEHFHRDRGNFSWRSWPAAMRDPTSPAVADFACEHRERVEFFQFLQWEADRQLAAAAGRDSGLAIGLYRDLAVGVDPHGAEAWADQELIAPGASIGAPPDALSRAGQNWGLAPINPLALRRRRFAPFITALRANMRHAGVLRIDHVMSLQRLYWIPSGGPAAEGAYVGYPFAELLRLVALESQRQKCAVVGEDLGTVPEGFRETMQAANVLSYRIFMFERRGDGGFVPPNDYPPLAAAAAATHDLATLKGYWLGRDIEWRRQLGLYPDSTAEAAETSERARDRWNLLHALAGQGLLAPERFPEFLPESGEPVYTAELGAAIHAYLARSRARLMLVQIEDAAGEAEQANLPGTSDGHPNWRRRMSQRLDDLLAAPETVRLAALVSSLRATAAAEVRRE